MEVEDEYMQKCSIECLNRDICVIHQCG